MELSPFYVYPNRKAWMQHFRDGIGASEADAVLGVSPWKTNEQLWEEQCGLAEAVATGDKT